VSWGERVDILIGLMDSITGATRQFQFFQDEKNTCSRSDHSFATEIDGVKTAADESSVRVDSVAEG